MGGSVPVLDEIVISLKKMSKIIKYNETCGILTLEAGVILQQANDYLK